MIDAAVAKHGKIRLLAQFQDFHGWDLHALWDDIKFATTHCLAIERIAMVGEKAWEKWMAKVCKPFTMAKIRYFDASELDAAKAWLAEVRVSTARPCFALGMGFRIFRCENHGMAVDSLDASYDRTPVYGRFRRRRY